MCCLGAPRSLNRACGAASVQFTLNTLCTDTHAQGSRSQLVFTTPLPCRALRPRLRTFRTDFVASANDPALCGQTCRLSARDLVFVNLFYRSLAHDSEDRIVIEGVLVA